MPATEKELCLENRLHNVVASRDYYRRALGEIRGKLLNARNEIATLLAEIETLKKEVK